jgi:hypothetical protein
MKLIVRDAETGLEPDTQEIALHEKWADGLMYCDMEGFYVGQDGTLILADECGNFRYCPEGRFAVYLKIIDPFEQAESTVKNV